MKLLVDLGNSYIKWSAATSVKDVGVSRRFAYSQEWSLALAHSVESEDFDEVVVASVVGDDQVNRVLAACEPRRVPVRVVSARAHWGGLVNAYTQPERMGVDRWLAMVSVWERYQSAFIVVDAGSALTVDVVSGNGVHEGGYIVPGLSMMRRSLVSSTAKVRFDFDKAPEQGLGASTQQSVDGGVMAMIIAMVKELRNDCERLSASGVALVVTGGDGELFASRWEGAEYRPLLVEEGLAVVAFAAKEERRE